MLQISSHWMPHTYGHFCRCVLLIWTRGKASQAARLTRQFCCPVIWGISSSSKHKYPPLTSDVFKSGCKYKPCEHILHIPMHQAGWMPLHNLFKIMKADMKESAFYNTPWQVQYFPLFMNTDAGEKRERNDAFFFFFFLRNSYLKKLFMFFLFLIPKLLMQKSRKTSERKKKYCYIYSATAGCASGCGTGCTEDNQSRQTNKWLPWLLRGFTPFQKKTLIKSTKHPRNNLSDNLLYRLFWSNICHLH